MTYKEAIDLLEKSKTSKGHYKADAVKALLLNLTTTKACPNCNGKGILRYSGDYAGPGADITCHVCNDVGRI